MDGCWMTPRVGILLTSGPSPGCLLHVNNSQWHFITVSISMDLFFLLFEWPTPLKGGDYILLISSSLKKLFCNVLQSEYVLTTGWIQFFAECFPHSSKVQPFGPRSFIHSTMALVYFAFHVNKAQMLTLEAHYPLSYSSCCSSCGLAPFNSLPQSWDLGSCMKPH